jgi:hypothetical protein
VKIAGKAAEDRPVDVDSRRTGTAAGNRVVTMPPTRTRVYGVAVSGLLSRALKIECP